MLQNPTQPEPLRVSAILSAAQELLGTGDLRQSQRHLDGQIKEILALLHSGQHMRPRYLETPRLFKAAYQAQSRPVTRSTPDSTQRSTKNQLSLQKQTSDAQKQGQIKGLQIRDALRSNPFQIKRIYHNVSNQQQQIKAGALALQQKIKNSTPGRSAQGVLDFVSTRKNGIHKQAALKLTELQSRGRENLVAMKQPDLIQKQINAALLNLTQNHSLPSAGRDIQNNLSSAREWTKPEKMMAASKGWITNQQAQAEVCMPSRRFEAQRQRYLPYIRTTAPHMPLIKPQPRPNTAHALSHALVQDTGLTQSYLSKTNIQLLQFEPNSSANQEQAGQKTGMPKWQPIERPKPIDFVKSLDPQPLLEKIHTQIVTSLETASQLAKSHRPEPPAEKQVTKKSKETKTALPPAPPLLEQIPLSLDDFHMAMIGQGRY